MDEKTPGVLISPLGLSPGAVSGVYFKLVADGFPIRKVVTLGTSDTDVVKAATTYLTPLFAHEQVVYEAIHIPNPELRGGNRVVKPYVALWGLMLEAAQREGAPVHVAVTAGRSGMGALAALAAGLYGADYLWHFWVREDIERDGSLKQGKLRPTLAAKLRENLLLNPTVETDACDLVALPFPNLRPLHPLIWQYRWTGALPSTAELRLDALLGWIETEDFLHIFPAGITFAAAQEIEALYAAYQQAPAEKAAIVRQLGEVLQQRGVVNSGERVQLVSLLVDGGDVRALLGLAAQAKDYAGFWTWLRTHQEQITAWTAPLPPKGIPPALLNRLRAVLIRCGWFESNPALKGQFTDQRIALWRDDLPQPESAGERVSRAIDYLHTQRNTRGENGLVLFLYVLRDALSPDAARHGEVGELIRALEAALQSGVTAAPPPLDAPCGPWFWAALRLYLRVTGRREESV